MTHKVYKEQSTFVSGNEEIVFTAAAPQQERAHPPIPVMPGITRGIDNKAPMVMMKLTTDVGLDFEGALGQGYVMCVIAPLHKYP